MPNFIQNRWFSVVMAIDIILLDQVSKWFANTHLPYSQPMPVVPMLNWTLHYNKGAAFGMLAEAGGWQRFFFAGLAILATVVIGYLLKTSQASQQLYRLGLACILGGAIGNLIDRVAFGHVIDFIDFYYQSYHFPIFNLADSAISLGVSLLLWDSLFLSKPTSSSQEQ